MSFTPFFLSLKLALFSTIILFIFCVPLAYFMARAQFRAKAIFEAIIALPLVLPPSVLGFYLLVFLSPYSFLGEFFERNFDLRLVFNFTGLIIASCIYSLPFMAQPKSIIEASYSLGHGRICTLLKVALPNIKPNILNAVIISFAHTLGEFGVVLMIGGSISDQTKVASIAIYDYVELMDYSSAHIYSAIMLGISFVMLFSVYFITNKMNKHNL